MDTDLLIRKLASDLKPVPRRSMAARLCIGAAAGAGLALAGVALVLGLRPDLARAVFGFTFWMKLTYVASLGAGGLLASVHLARPEARPTSRFWLLIVPVFVLADIAAWQFYFTASSLWPKLILGDSARVCSTYIFLISIPVFAGLLVAFRRFAPTRLRAAGAAAGLAAGGIAASVYSLHCPEVGAAFVLIWYSLGILAAALAGAVLGPLVLRW